MPGTHKRLNTNMAWLTVLGTIFLAAAAQATETAPDTKAEKIEKKNAVNELKGQVKDAKTGEPVSGVIVAVAAVDVGHIIWGAGGVVHAFAPEERGFLFFSKLNGRTSGREVTDADGRFAITNLAHGEYNIAAILPDKGLTLKEGVAFKEDTGDIELLLEPLPRDAALTAINGRVLDHEGHPVANAKVAASNAEKGYLYCHGSDNIQAMFFGFDNDKAWFSRQTGAGGAGQTITDDEGRFTIDRLMPTAYNIVAIHADKGVKIIEGRQISENAEPVEIKLNPPTFLEGTIKGLKLKKGKSFGFGLTAIFSPSTALDNWTMLNLAPEGLPDNVHFDIPLTLEHGKLSRVGPLPSAEKWTVMASKYVNKQGYMATLLTAPVDIQSGKTAKLNIDLTRGNELSGEVRGPKGELLSGVSILARPTGESRWAYGGVTDDKGKYLIPGLPAGDYMLEALRHTIRTAPG